MPLRPNFGCLMKQEEREITLFINSLISLKNDLNCLVLVFLIPVNEQLQRDYPALGTPGAPIPLLQWEGKVRVQVLHTWDKYTTEYVLRKSNTNLGFGIFNFYIWPENASNLEAPSMSPHLNLWVRMSSCLANLKKYPIFLKSRGSSAAFFCPHHSKFSIL